MKAYLQENGNTAVLAKNNGDQIAFIAFERDIDQGEKQRVLEILNDVDGLETGEFRKLLVPIVAEMVRQNFDVLEINRYEGAKIQLSLTPGEPKGDAE